MPARRRVSATLTSAEAVGLQDGRGGNLWFRPQSRIQLVSRVQQDQIADLVPLGPEPSVETVAGVAKLLRLLRAARLRLPPPESLVGDSVAAAERLQSAIGRSVLLEVRPRARVRFTVWTDEGVECMSDVFDVAEDESSFRVHRLRGLRDGSRRTTAARGTRTGSRPRSRRGDRAAVAGTAQPSREAWLEVTSIERG